jgi:hypothetical protein
MIARSRSAFERGGAACWSTSEASTAGVLAIMPACERVDEEEKEHDADEDEDEHSDKREVDVEDTAFLAREHVPLRDTHSTREQVSFLRTEQRTEAS